MSTTLFTSEAVSGGHPDKVADQISDAIVDACLRVDPFARVACETLVTAGQVVLAGEVTTTASVDYAAIARETIGRLGYDRAELGFCEQSVGVLMSLHQQSPDIAQGVGVGLNEQLGAGDQGIVFGFACDDTPELMPLPHVLSHALLRALDEARRSGRLPYLGPDAKSQVTVAYDSDLQPQAVTAVVVSTQHDEQQPLQQLRNDIGRIVEDVIPESYRSQAPTLHINPSGRFVLGGPAADTGLTGRKPIVDTYGGMGRHGGGAFSGKDPTKVDRSGAYAARYAAKNIVAAGFARRCEVQLGYAIGMAEPVSVQVDCKGSASVDEARLVDAVVHLFPVTPFSIIESFDLLRPIYLETANGGHFGRPDQAFPWERIDKIEALKTYLAK